MNDYIVHQNKFWCIKSGLGGVVKNTMYKIASIGSNRSTGKINYFSLRADNEVSVTIHPNQFKEFERNFITKEQYDIINNRKSKINKLLENEK